MRLLIVATLVLSASGCGPAAPTDPRTAAPTATKAAGDAAIERDVASIRADVTRTSETQRLNELERRIGRLEATPDKLDLELLATRVQALEGRAGIDGLGTPVALPGTPPAPARTPSPAKAPTSARKPPTAKPSPAAVPSPVRKPTPRLRPSPTTGATGSTAGVASGAGTTSSASAPDAR